jgi:hypothetical protein
MVVYKRLWLSKVPVPDDLRRVEPQVRLWRAVIDQLVTDYVVESTDPTSRKRAKIWLRGNTVDFNDVCELAGFTPAQVKKFIANQIGELDQLYD